MYVSAVIPTIPSRLFCELRSHSPQEDKTSERDKNFFSSTNVPLTNDERLTSSVLGAAHVLHCLQLTADLIYIDGDHDYLPAKNDLTAFWPLLKPDGILFGDDYSTNWPGVQLAVQELCETEKVKMTLNEVTWSIRKPIK
jgi:predicted O-methyltransferase YrrM